MSALSHDRKTFRRLACLLPVLLALPALSAREPGPVPAAPPGWTAGAPRDEIRPRFACDPAGGPDGKGSLIIEADGREGLDGYWTKTFDVAGGKHYRFHVLQRAAGVSLPRRSAVVKIHWRDGGGKAVPHDEPAVTGYLKGEVPMAE